MKVICDRGTLVELLNLTGAVIVSRTPKPALTCVKLEAGETGLTLMATDMEHSLRLRTNKVEVSQPGEALIPADKFTQIVRESVDSTITLEVNQQEAKIRGHDSLFNLYCLPPTDFPPVPSFAGEADFQIGAGELHRLIRQTIFAVARENSRYAINGVLIERDGNKVNLVATDGRRLALAKGACKTAKSAGSGSAEAGRHSAIVPTKALTLILRLFTNAEDTVRIKVAENQMLFATDDAVMATNLVEGNFPPYRDVIPKDGDKKATLKTDLLASAVRRGALLTNEESKGVRLAFAPTGLTLSSRAPEMGDATINVEMPAYEGEPVEIGFNPGFISDALKVVDQDEVTIELKAPNKPGILRTGPDFLYVIMPVNLQ
ncbi:MAG: DNA polymerase III subunit beta [Phycisphaeraceae bacterium]|nr:DNA polymerase III subunit beta [Phycisphaeraceae bacterium]